jgi:hypothetical protein
MSDHAGVELQTHEHSGYPTPKEEAHMGLLKCPDCGTAVSDLAPVQDFLFRDQPIS